MKEKGFSLVEIILVVAIISIIGAFSMPFFGRFITQNGVANTVDQLVMDLRKAQFYSMMSRGSDVSGWGVNYQSNTITLYQGSSFAGRNTALDETFTVNSNVSITGIGDINFARVTGIPASTATIGVTGLNTTKTLTLNSQGMISR